MHKFKKEHFEYINYLDILKFTIYLLLCKNTPVAYWIKNIKLKNKEQTSFLGFSYLIWAVTVLETTNKKLQIDYKYLDTVIEFYTNLIYLKLTYMYICASTKLVKLLKNCHIMNTLFSIGFSSIFAIFEASNCVVVVVFGTYCVFVYIFFIIHRHVSNYLQFGSVLWLEELNVQLVSFENSFLHTGWYAP